MSKLKKLCYILPSFDLETDTHYFYLYDFIKRIADDFDLTLVIEKSNSDIIFFDNIRHIKVQKFNRGIFRVLENFILILFLRLKGNKDFYIHYSQVSAFNASLIVRIFGGRTFYWNCGMMWLFGTKKFLGLILKIVTHLVTGANVLADGYAEHYHIGRDKIKIMPNWIDLNRFSNINIDEVYKKYNLNPHTKYLLFVHRLAERKGAHYIATLVKNNPNYNFLIAGDGPYRGQLEEEISGWENIMLLGKIPNHDIPGLMKISSLFFMPSEEEGFPRVLLESMAAGLPYVAFDIGGVREISTEAQQSYIVDDIEAMDRAIKDILQNDDIYNKLREVNLEHVRQFDINVTKNRFVELIIK